MAFLALFFFSPFFLFFPFPLFFSFFPLFPFFFFLTGQASGVEILAHRLDGVFPPLFFFFSLLLAFSK